MPVGPECHPLAPASGDGASRLPHQLRSMLPLASAHRAVAAKTTRRAAPPCPSPSGAGRGGFALLTGRWRALQCITAGPSRIGHITAAAPTLTEYEQGRYTHLVKITCAAPPAPQHRQHRQPVRAARVSRSRSRRNLNTGQIEFNTSLSKARAAVEHAIAHLKAWRMLSEEGGRYRAPLEKYPSMIKAVI